jgi:hypothetical protein
VTRLFVDRLNAAIQGTLDRPQAVAETVVVLNTQFTEIPESVRDQVPRNHGGLLRSQPERTIPRRAIANIMILILLSFFPNPFLSKNYLSFFEDDIFG